MLLPDKHVRFAESLLGLGAFVLERLEKPKSLDLVWQELGNAAETERMPATHSFEKLVLAVYTLYAIGAVRLDDEGRLAKCV